MIPGVVGPKLPPYRPTGPPYSTGYKPIKCCTFTWFPGLKYQNHLRFQGARFSEEAVGRGVLQQTRVAITGDLAEDAAVPWKNVRSREEVYGDERRRKDTKGMNVRHVASGSCQKTSRQSLRQPKQVESPQYVWFDPAAPACSEFHDKKFQCQDRYSPGY